MPLLLHCQLLSLKRFRPLAKPEAAGIPKHQRHQRHHKNAYQSDGKDKMRSCPLFFVLFSMSGTPFRSQVSGASRSSASV